MWSSRGEGLAARQAVTCSMIIRRLKADADNVRRQNLMRFFKTGPGEYGEGDKFLGLTVPQIRAIVKEHRAMGLGETLKLLKSSFHEARLAALLLLVDKYRACKSEKDRKQIYRAYLKNHRYINNWDLVDLSAEHIVGAYLFDKGKEPVYRLARAKTLWQRRIAVLATFYSIRENDFAPTFKVAAMLLKDDEDLIHKAVGWMLREVGKRDIKAEEGFLKKHCKKMPRTMLRYAIEKFPKKKRMAYMQKKS